MEPQIQPQAQPEQPQQQPNPYMSPNPGQFNQNPGQYQSPINQPAKDPGKTLGVVGLIMAFVGLSVIGLILSIVSRSKSKYAGFNNNLALVGIIINIIFLIVSIPLIFLTMMSFTAVKQTSQVIDMASSISATAKAYYQDNGTYPDEISDFNEVDGEFAKPANVTILNSIDELSEANASNSVVYQYTGEFGASTGGKIIYWDYRIQKITDRPVAVGTAITSSQFYDLK